MGTKPNKTSTSTDCSKPPCLPDVKERVCLWTATPGLQAEERVVREGSKPVVKFDRSKSSVTARGTGLVSQTTSKVQPCSDIARESGNLDTNQVVSQTAY